MGAFARATGDDKLVTMKSSMKHRLLISVFTTTLFSMVLTSTSWAKLQYDADQLMMKNAEQVTEMVRRRIKKAQDIQSKQDLDDDVGIQAEPDAIAELTDGVSIILSRPDQDGTRTNVFARLRRELMDLNALEPVLKDLTHEAIGAIKSSSVTLRRQATYVVFLENLMAELKPEVSTNTMFKSLVEQIRDADLKISDQLRARTLLRSMSKIVSPSETAAKIVPKEDPKKTKK